MICSDEEGARREIAVPKWTLGCWYGLHSRLLSLLMSTYGVEALQLIISLNHTVVIRFCSSPICVVVNQQMTIVGGDSAEGFVIVA